MNPIDPRGSKPALMPGFIRLCGLVYCAALLGLSITACGHRTSPRPVSIAVPGQIDLVGAYAYPDRITLRWRTPKLNADGSVIKKLSGFKVYRKTIPMDDDCDDCMKRRLHYFIDLKKPVSADIDNDLVVYTDFDVEKGSVYVYEVAAQNYEGRESELSQPVEVVYDDPPPKPKGLFASLDGEKVRLEWTAPRRPSGIRGYRIYRGSSGDIWKMDLLGQTRWAENYYLDADTSKGSNYYYSVRSYKMAKGVSIQSEPSDIITIFVPGAIPPPPANVNAVDSGNMVKLFWNPVKIENKTILYNVYRSKGGEEFVKINSDPLDKAHFDDKSVETDTTYRYRITSLVQGSEGQESRYSKWVSVDR